MIKNIICSTKKIFVIFCLSFTYNIFGAHAPDIRSGEELKELKQQIRDTTNNIKRRNPESPQLKALEFAAKGVEQYEEGLYSSAIRNLHAALISSNLPSCLKTLNSPLAYFRKGGGA